jgi:hypothetical protein
MVVRRSGDAGGGATTGSGEAADGAAADGGATTEVCGDAVERIAVGRGGEAGGGAAVNSGEAADGVTAVDACGDAGSSGGIGSGVGVGKVGITGGVWGSDSGEAWSRVSLFIGSVNGERGGNMA